MLNEVKLSSFELFSFKSLYFLSLALCHKSLDGVCPLRNPCLGHGMQVLFAILAVFHLLNAWIWSKSLHSKSVQFIYSDDCCRTWVKFDRRFGWEVECLWLQVSGRLVVKRAAVCNCEFSSGAKEGARERTLVDWWRHIVISIVAAWRFFKMRGRSMMQLDWEWGQWRGTHC